MIQKSSIFFSFFTFLLLVTSSGQDQNKVDSLTSLLKTNLTNTQKADVYIHLARTYKHIDTVIVSAYAGNALKLAQSANYQKGIVDVHVIYGNIALEIADFYRAGSLFEKAYDLANEVDYYIGMSNALTNLGLVRWNTGEYDAALDLFNQSKEILGKSDGPKNYVPLYNNIALLHYMKGDYDRAIANFKECVRIYEEEGNLHGLGRILVNLGVMYMETGDYDTCLEYYFRALDIQKEFGQKNNMAANYNNIGATYRNQSIYDSALNYFKKSMLLNQELGLKKRITENYTNLGSVHNDQGNYDSAEFYFQKAVQSYQEMNDLYNLSLANRNVGDSYYNRGDYPLAFEYYLKALDIASGIEAKAEIARTLNSLGMIYQSQNELEKALNSYWESNQISQSIDEKRVIAMSYGNIGSTYHLMNKLDSALYSHQQALTIHKEINNQYGVTNSYLLIASVLIEQANYTDAANYSHLGLELSQELGLKELEAAALLYKGNVQSEIGEIDQGLDLIIKGTDLAKKIGSKSDELYGRRLLKKIYESLGDYQKAYENQLLVTALSDSIYSEESTKRMTRLEAEYEFRVEKDSIRFANEKEKLALAQKIDKQQTTQLITFLVLLFAVILLLLVYRMYRNRSITNRKLQALNDSIIERNEEITQQRDQLNANNRKLVTLNEDKNRILAVVAHDIRNPLQLIKGYVSLVKARAADKLERELEFLDHALEASERVSDMISELLDMSALESKQVDVRLQQINIKELLEQLAVNFSFSAREKNQQIVKNLPDSELRIKADKNYLIRVLENLISNALKFSEKGTEVTISAYKQDDSVLILVKDAGPGISEKDQEKMFQEFSQLSARATGKEQSTGLGLSIVKKYVEAMDGMITFHSQLGEGTKFVLDFKSI